MTLTIFELNSFYFSTTFSKKILSLKAPRSLAFFDAKAITSSKLEPSKVARELITSNISANSKGIIYAAILSKDEPKCETLDDLAYLIWKHVCGRHFALQESINEDQI